MLANPETPERYTKTALFNKKYAPMLVADKFSKENVCKLAGEYKNSKIVLKFDAINNLTYKLFRIEEDSQKLMKTFSNSSGQIVFEDKNINKDTIYTYYVEILESEQNENKGQKTKSNSVKIKTESTNGLKKILNFWW